MNFHPSPRPFPPARTDRVRVIALMAKRPDISEDDFYKYWQQIHGPLFANLDIVRKNILKYEQHHYTDEFNPRPSDNSLPYHGIAVFEAESYDKVAEVFCSEEYARTVYPDEVNFIVREKTNIISGPIITFINN